MLSGDPYHKPGPVSNSWNTAPLMRWVLPIEVPFCEPASNLTRSARIVYGRPADTTLAARWSVI